MRRPLLGLGIALGIALPGHAATQSFQGRFQADDDLAIFSFEMPSSGPFSAVTWSHSGGVNAAGALVPAGGFAPVLAVFDADGLVAAINVGSKNDCTDVGSFCWDARLTTGLQAGAYLLVLSQDGNEPAPSGPVTASTVASAYPMTGQPAYTNLYAGSSDPAVRFIRLDGTARTGDWAVDIMTTNPVTQVPEPGTWLLWGVGLLGLTATMRAGRRGQRVAAPMQGAE